ncbi:hypothetical protein [Serinicoccus marinus]|uniref:hypothetical protein n=1 Tax=Serinicoccus marinus TaxID=247333 RepID=UPI001EE95579|nr:hypothetical protein [Serinicoccus marinus]
MATSTAPRQAARTGPPSILLKTVVAVTGLLFVGFLLVHMYGNLMILAGPEASTSTPTTCGPSVSR